MSPTLRICATCGNKHFLNPKGATALILTQDNSLIFGVRGHEPKKGKLDCIGGFLDYGENFEQGLYRELKEESGLLPGDISTPKYIGSVFDIYPWQGDEVPVVSSYYVAELKPGKTLVAGDDIAEIVYCDPGSIKLIDCAWGGMRKILVDNKFLG